MNVCQICGTEWRGNHGECCRAALDELREQLLRVEAELAVLQAKVESVKNSASAAPP